MNRQEALDYLKSQGANIEILRQEGNNDEAIIQIAEAMKRLFEAVPAKVIPIKKYCRRCKCAFPEIHANGLCDFCLFDAIEERRQRA